MDEADEVCGSFVNYSDIIKIIDVRSLKGKNSECAGIDFSDSENEDAELDVEMISDEESQCETLKKMTNMPLVNLTNQVVNNTEEEHMEELLKITHEMIEQGEEDLEDSDFHIELFGGSMKKQIDFDMHYFKEKEFHLSEILYNSQHCIVGLGEDLSSEESCNVSSERENDLQNKIETTKTVINLSEDYGVGDADSNLTVDLSKVIYNENKAYQGKKCSKMNSNTTNIGYTIVPGNQYAVTKDNIKDKYIEKLSLETSEPADVPESRASFKNENTVKFPSIVKDKHNFVMNSVLHSEKERQEKFLRDIVPNFDGFTPVKNSPKLKSVTGLGQKLWSVKAVERKEEPQLSNIRQHKGEVTEPTASVIKNTNLQSRFWTIRTDSSTTTLSRNGSVNMISSSHQYESGLKVADVEPSLEMVEAQDGRSKHEKLAQQKVDGTVLEKGIISSYSDNSNGSDLLLTVSDLETKKYSYSTTIINQANRESFEKESISAEVLDTTKLYVGDQKVNISGSRAKNINQLPHKTTAFDHLGTEARKLRNEMKRTDFGNCYTSEKEVSKISVQVDAKINSDSLGNATRALKDKEIEIETVDLFEVDSIGIQENKKHLDIQNAFMSKVVRTAEFLGIESRKLRRRRQIDYKENDLRKNVIIDKYVRKRKLNINDTSGSQKKKASLQIDNEVMALRQSKNMKIGLYKKVITDEELNNEQQDAKKSFRANAMKTADILHSEPGFHEINTRTTHHLYSTTSNYNIKQMERKHQENFGKQINKCQLDASKYIGLLESYRLRAGKICSLAGLRKHFGKDIKKLKRGKKKSVRNILPELYTRSLTQSKAASMKIKETDDANSKAKCVYENIDASECCASGLDQGMYCNTNRDSVNCSRLQELARETNMEIIKLDKSNSSCGKLSNLQSYSHKKEKNTAKLLVNSQLVSLQNPNSTSYQDEAKASSNNTSSGKSEELNMNSKCTETEILPVNEAFIINKHIAETFKDSQNPIDNDVGDSNIKDCINFDTKASLTQAIGPAELPDSKSNKLTVEYTEEKHLMMKSNFNENICKMCTLLPEEMYKLSKIPCNLNIAQDKNKLDLRTYKGYSQGNKHAICYNIQCNRNCLSNKKNCKPRKMENVVSNICTSPDKQSSINNEILFDNILGKRKLLVYLTRCDAVSNVKKTRLAADHSELNASEANFIEDSSNRPKKKAVLLNTQSSKSVQSSVYESHHLAPPVLNNKLKHTLDKGVDRCASEIFQEGSKFGSFAVKDDQLKNNTPSEVIKVATKLACTELYDSKIVNSASSWQKYFIKNILQSKKKHNKELYTESRNHIAAELVSNVGKETVDALAEDCYDTIQINKEPINCKADQDLGNETIDTSSKEVGDTVKFKGHCKNINMELYQGKDKVLYCFPNSVNQMNINFNIKVNGVDYKTLYDRSAAKHEVECNSPIKSCCKNVISDLVMSSVTTVNSCNDEVASLSDGVIDRSSLVKQLQNISIAGINDHYNAPSKKNIARSSSYQTLNKCCLNVYTVNDSMLANTLYRHINNIYSITELITMKNVNPSSIFNSIASNQVLTLTDRSCFGTLESLHAVFDFADSLPTKNEILNSRQYPVIIEIRKNLIKELTEVTVLFCFTRNKSICGFVDTLDKYYECPVCLKSFCGKMFGPHLAQYVKVSNFSCNKCRLILSSLHLLKHHYATCIAVNGVIWE